MKKDDQIHAILSFWLQYSLAQNKEDLHDKLSACKKAKDNFLKKYEIKKKK